MIYSFVMILVCGLWLFVLSLNMFILLPTIACTFMLCDYMGWDLYGKWGAGRVCVVTLFAVTSIFVWPVYMLVLWRLLPDAMK